MVDSYMRISPYLKLKFFEQDEYAVQLNSQEPGYDWEDGEDQVRSSQHSFTL